MKTESKALIKQTANHLSDNHLSDNHLSDNHLIEVSVKLHGVLRRHRPGGIEGPPHHPFSMELPSAATVDDLGVSLGLSRSVSFVVAVNGEAAELATALHQGDVVYFFPPAAGG